MSLYLHFILSFGALLALMGVIAAWMFRTAAAPLWAKLAVPSLAVALACYAPFAVSAMMGLPVSADMAALPDRAELVAFVVHDEGGLVDLWLRPATGSGQAGDASASSGQAVPRSYETNLTPSLKKTLQRAQEAHGRGQIAMLAKRGNASKRGAGDRLGIGDDQDAYVLDGSALSSLPPKE